MDGRYEQVGHNGPAFAVSDETRPRARSTGRERRVCTRFGLTLRLQTDRGDHWKPSTFMDYVVDSKNSRKPLRKRRRRHSYRSFVKQNAARFARSFAMPEPVDLFPQPKFATRHFSKKLKKIMSGSIYQKTPIATAPKFNFSQRPRHPLEQPLAKCPNYSGFHHSLNGRFDNHVRPSFGFSNPRSSEEAERLNRAEMTSLMQLSARSTPEISDNLEPRQFEIWSRNNSDNIQSQLKRDFLIDPQLRKRSSYSGFQEFENYEQSDRSDDNNHLKRNESVYVELKSCKGSKSVGDSGESKQAECIRPVDHVSGFYYDKLRRRGNDESSGSKWTNKHLGMHTQMY